MSPGSPFDRVVARTRGLGAALAAGLLLAGCASDEPVPVRSTLSPAQARAMVAKALPPGLSDRQGWATDIYAGLSAVQVPINPSNACAVVAIIEQESSFRANPSVPGLPAIAWREIDAKAQRAGVPGLVVRAALLLPSPNGRSYSERIDSATTEKDLSDVFEDFIGMVPLGKRFFGDANPVRTGGPMQVSIAWAQAYVATRPYPYPGAENIRREVFTRRGGLYFGIAHLLDYPASYDRPLYRFADFNAGHHASRNAAFQNAVSIVSGVPLALDGDLIQHGAAGDTPIGATEAAVRVIGARIGQRPEAIRSALEQGGSPQFARTPLYARVFELADRAEGRPVPRALVPRIQLKSPKITRDLTTEWFARRVDERHQRCVARVGDPAS